MQALLDATYRNAAKIAEYRNRFPKCIATLSAADAETVERIYSNWLKRQATYHRDCFKRCD
jgi:hypothetical protein